MEISKFIEETIEQISRGIIDSQKNIKIPYVNVNPNYVINETNDPIDIEFDIAVSVISETETSGEAGVRVGILALGTGGKTGKGDRLESRVKFKLPVNLPESSLSLHRSKTP